MIDPTHPPKLRKVGRICWPHLYDIGQLSSFHSDIIGLQMWLLKEAAPEFGHSHVLPLSHTDDLIIWLAGSFSLRNFFLRLCRLMWFFWGLLVWWQFFLRPFSLMACFFWVHIIWCHFLSPFNLMSFWLRPFSHKPFFLRPLVQCSFFWDLFSLMRFFLTYFSLMQFFLRSFSLMPFFLRPLVWCPFFLRPFSPMSLFSETFLIWWRFFWDPLVWCIFFWDYIVLCSFFPLLVWCCFVRSLMGLMGKVTLFCLWLDIRGHFIWCLKMFSWMSKIYANYSQQLNSRSCC